MTERQVNVKFSDEDLEAWTVAGTVANAEAVRRLIDNGLRYAMMHQGVSVRLVEESQDVRALYRKCYDAYRTEAGQESPLGNQFHFVRVPEGSPYFDEGGEAVIPLHRDLERLTKTGEIAVKTSDGWTVRRIVTVADDDLLSAEGEQ